MFFQTRLILNFEKGIFLFRSFFVREGFVLIWFWLFIVFLLIVLTILILSYVQGELHFSRAVEQDYLELKIKVIWGVKMNRFFPMIKMMDYSKRIPFTSDNSKSTPKTNHATKHRVKGKMKGSFQNAKLLMQNTVHWYEWLKHTLSRIECTRLNWITRVGMGDATHTAIATGAVWGLKTSSLGFIMHLVQVKSKPLIQVVPQYTHVQFSTDFNGAAGIRIIDILWSGIELVWRVMKIKGGLRTWYHVMSKTKAMTKIS
jgi:cell division protein FtsI/penicillin-binding protein 2